MSSISGIYSIAIYGLNSATRQLTASAQEIVNDAADPSGSDDLDRAILNLPMIQQTYEANAQTLKAAHQLLGTVMDVLDTPLRT